MAKDQVLTTSKAEKSSDIKTKPKATKKSSTDSTKATRSKATKKTSTSTKSRKLLSNVIAEYYDLPYRYNETIVKILYQTPTILFVYWDISDEDRANYIRTYGEHFFYNTQPVLKIYNLTKNYSFEVEINDFANSWYINNVEPECKYKVELSRRIIKHEENLNTINNDYIYCSIRSKNEIAVVSMKDDKLIQSVYCCGNHPRDFIIVDDYLLCANRFSNNFVSFKILGDGTLSEMIDEVTIPEGVALIV